LSGAFRCARPEPLSRLYVTHYHPDHLLGAAAFDAPAFTLASVAAKVETSGDRVAREEHEKVGDDIPLTARRPDVRIDGARKSSTACASSIAGARFLAADEA
jgi:glyoxylase-like metal-dependent hydrolase (beta-lactamase superfamily II)